MRQRAASNVLTFSQFCKHSEEEVHTGQKQGGLNVSQKSLSDDIFEKSLSDEISYGSLLYFFVVFSSTATPLLAVVESS